MILLKVNSKLIRERLKKAGFSICPCCEFGQSVWLSFTPNITFNIHGIGYPIDEYNLYNVEDILRLYESELTSEDIDCGYDVEKFIQLCKEELNKNKE